MSYAYSVMKHETLSTDDIHNMHGRGFLYGK